MSHEHNLLTVVPKIIGKRLKLVEYTLNQRIFLMKKKIMPKELIFSLTCLFLRCTQYLKVYRIIEHVSHEQFFPKIIGRRLKLEKVYIKSEDIFKKRINNA